MGFSIFNRPGYSRRGFIYIYGGYGIFVVCMIPKVIRCFTINGMSYFHSPLLNLSSDCYFQTASLLFLGLKLGALVDLMRLSRI